MSHYYLYRISDGKLLSDSAQPIVPLTGTAVYTHTQVMNVDTEKWDTVTKAVIANSATPFIAPVVTKQQAKDTLKTLLETTPGNWTAAQEKQALYAVLLFAFREALKDGTVY